MNSSRKIKIDIIGAGISGLATAHYLSNLSDTFLIRVWEKDEIAGGLAGNFMFGKDIWLEKFYHHIFKKDSALLQLISELGLDSELGWQAAGTGSYYFKQAYRLSSPLDLLKFKPLPLLDRFRMGLMVLLARTVKDWKYLDDISARDYIIKKGGKKVYEVVWQPLLKGKFGNYVNEISAAWIWSKFVDRGRSRDKKGFEILGYLKGGLGKMFDCIVAELRAKGHEVNFNAEIKGFHLSSENKISSIFINDQVHETDIVVSAVQVPDLVNMLPEKLEFYKNKLRNIRFLSNVCLVLSLKHSLSKFYWTNVTDPEAPFVGIIEQTKWIDKKEYGNKHIVYISSYVVEGDERLSMTATQLQDYYLPYIKRMFPDFNKESIVESKIWKAPYTQPIVQKTYRKSIPEIQSPVNNLFVCTMAQIYPNDRQVSNGVEMAIKTVNLISKKYIQS